MEPIDELLDALVDDRVVGDVIHPRIELRRGGQLAVEQQVRRFQERAPLGQLLDRIAAVAQDPLVAEQLAERSTLDRKSTRLNSSHSQISYAVFCLKKKKSN